MRKLVASGVALLLVISAVGHAAAASIPAPVALEATGGAGRIDLWWQYGAPGQYPGLDFFRVYRSVDNGVTFCLYDTVTWTSGTSPEYTDHAPPKGPFVTVYYVTAVDQSGSETGRSNTAAAYPTSGGVTNATCDGSGGDPGGGDPGGGDPGGGDPGGGDPGGGDPGGGDPGGGDPGEQECDLCSLLDSMTQAIWGVYDGIIGVQVGVSDLDDYLRYPTAPLPTPPSVPTGPGYTPPPAPDLTPVMPQLGRRTGRQAPTVPTLHVPADIPAPPALPPIEEPAVSPWGLPIAEPGTAEPVMEHEQPATPEDPLMAVQPPGPQTPVLPEEPRTAEPARPADTAITPHPPRSASPAPMPTEALSPREPMTPAAPLWPDPPGVPGG